MTTDHCHCWDDAIGPCCWCGNNWPEDDDDPDDEPDPARCEPHEDGRPCAATRCGCADPNRIDPVVHTGLIPPPYVP